MPEGSEYGNMNFEKARIRAIQRFRFYITHIAHAFSGEDILLEWVELARQDFLKNARKKPTTCRCHETSTNLIIGIGDAVRAAKPHTE